MKLPDISSWLYAIRPKTLVAALTPVIVGTALAGKENPIFYGKMALAFLFIVALQIATNLFNDVLDFEKGADTKERMGPVRVTASGLIAKTHVFFAAYTCLFIAAVAALPLLSSIAMSALAALCLSLTYLYTGGPYPLAYKGLGDLFVFLFFGLVAVNGAYYIQTGSATSASLLAGCEVGLLATVLIAINNLRDIAQDERAKKRTLAVRFGKTFARVQIGFCALIPFGLVVTHTWLPLLILPLALKIVWDVRENEPSALYNQFLGRAALLQMVFGLLLAFS